MIGQLIGRYLCDIAAVLPLGVVGFLGIALAWQHKQTHTRPAWMVIAGCALLIVTEAIQKTAHLVMAVTGFQTIWLYTGISVLHTAGLLIASLLVLIAIPMGRTAPAREALWD